MNKLSSALGAIVVTAIIVIFIVQFQAASPTSARSDNGPKCAVEVRGSCISRTTFDAAYRLIRANADPGRLRSMGFGKKVAEGLVETWLLDQDAKRLGIAVDDKEVTAEIATGRAHVSLPAADARQLGYSLQLGEDLVRQIPVKSPKTKHFDAKYAEKMIRTYTRMSPSDFREYQRSEMTAAYMRELITSRVRISENEAFDQFSRERSTVTLDYARFDRRFFADLLVDLSPKAVSAWADANKEEVDKSWEGRKAQVLPECRSAREIFVKLDEAPSDEEKAKARARIDRALERIRKGEDFGDVARAMSDGPTAARGGEIGCLLKGKTPKPLEEAAAALAAGKVSDVVTTEGGFYLVKVEQIAKDADAEALGRAQAAQELYVAHESERLALEASKKVAAAVKGGRPLKEALDQYLAELKLPAVSEKKDGKKGDKKADEKKKADDQKGDEKKSDEKKADDDRPALTLANHPNRPTLETTLPFNVNGDPIPGVHQKADLTKTAFALEKPGDAPSDVIPFDSGYVAVQLKEKTPITKQQWEENKDRDLYLGAMRAAKANDALVAYVKRLRDQPGGEPKFTKELVEEKASKGGDSAPVDDESGE